MLHGKNAEPILPSLKQGFTSLVIGATGAIGGALSAALMQDENSGPVVTLGRRALSRSDAAQSRTHLICDVTDETHVQATAEALSVSAPFDLVINATGLLHDEASGVRPEKAVRQISADAMARVRAVNAIGPALIMRYFLPLMVRDNKAVMAHLSARVGSVSDNRLGGWYSYRAAKAAQNMLVATAAIEWARRAPNTVIVGLHPGTVDRSLSPPFQSATAAHKLFEPAQSAAYLLGVIDALSPADSGGVFAWDGARIQP